MCQRGLCAHVPKTYQRLIFTCQRVNKCANVSTCHRRAIYSTWRANVPKAWQYFNIACQRVKKGANFSTSPAKKAYQFFNFFVFQFLNFSIMLNICKFLEYLANSRKLSRETKNLNFDICKISLRKNFINLKPIIPFSAEHVGLIEQLFGQCKMELNIFLFI